MKLLVMLVFAALAALATGAIVLFAGWYDISATDEHLRPTYWALDIAMRRSVRQRAEQIEVPVLDDPQLLRDGFALYREHCEQCHGGPGVAPKPFALGLTPTPANLAYTAREWPSADLFWVVKEGIKMTGMPAWRFRLDDLEIWAIVAFMRRMATMTPAAYMADDPPPVAARIEVSSPPDADRGRRAVHQYACLTCHEIPGLVGANAPVGPPLSGMGTRAVIAGRLVNTPENLVRWLREPQRVNPGSAMPDLGLTERDARDIAAFLGTLR